MIRKRGIISALLLVASVVPCLAQNTAFSLVKGGRAASVILVRDERSPVAREAAEEPARVVLKAVGISLLVYREGELSRLEDRGYPV